jgi:hypothetical protein
MRLIHLSDIHFNVQPDWDPDGDQREQLLRDIGELVDEGGEVDGILIGGDIAFSGKKAEYDVAAEWIERVRQRSGCPDGAIWVVPGNHDVDRDLHKDNRARSKMVDELSTSDLDVIDVRLAGWLRGGDGMLGCLAAYNAFSQPWVAPTTHKKPHWEDLTLGLDGLSVCLTGINSAVASDSRDKPPPRLVLGRQQCELPVAEDRIHIVLAHHPPTWIRDWDNVKGYLRRAHLVLFGHEHRFRVHQDAPGLTVTVYAGAVGPERPGPDPSPMDTEHDDEGFVPSWNLIQIDREGNELVVTIDPRVWAEEPHFERHAEGIQKRRVRIDLKPIASAANDPGHGEVLITDPGPAPEPPAPAEVEHPGSNSSPLIPDTTEVLEGVPLPSDAIRAERRALAVAFMRQSPTERLRIAEELEVAGGLAEQGLPSSEEGREILRRVRAANKIDQLKGLLNA